MKVCSSSLHVGANPLPFSEFYRDSRRYSSWCKNCCREYSQRRVASGENRATHQRRAIRLAESNLKGPRVRLSPLQRLAREHWRQLYKRAIRLAKEFTLSKECMETLFEDFCKTNHHALSGPFCPSIDRIDNARCYTLDNVRVIWRIENYARNVFTDEVVLEFCRRKLANACGLVTGCDLI